MQIKLKTAVNSEQYERLLRMRDLGLSDWDIAKAKAGGQSPMSAPGPSKPVSEVRDIVCCVCGCEHDYVTLLEGDGFQQLTMSYWLKVARIKEVSSRDVLDHYNDVLWLKEQLETVLASHGIVVGKESK